MLRFFQKLLSAVAERGVVGEFAPSDGRLREFSIRELVAYVVFSPGTTGGVVVIEAAHEGAFAGSWAPLARVAWEREHRVHAVNLTGPQRAIRMRVDTAIVGGTVDGFLGGN